MLGVGLECGTEITVQYTESPSEGEGTFVDENYSSLKRKRWTDTSTQTEIQVAAERKTGSVLDDLMLKVQNVEYKNMAKGKKIITYL